MAEPMKLYDCCEHCEHDINDAPHDSPCPEGCDGIGTASMRSTTRHTIGPVRKGARRSEAIMTDDEKTTDTVRILTWLASNPGSTSGEIAAAVGLSRQHVHVCLLGAEIGCGAVAMGEAVMTRKPVKLSPQIDPFRERQVPDVAGRFLKYRTGHQRHTDMMWLGALVQFSDHELRLLDDLGYLSQRDRGLLRQAGRSVQPAVTKEASREGAGDGSQ